MCLISISEILQGFLNSFVFSKDYLIPLNLLISLLANFIHLHFMIWYVFGRCACLCVNVCEVY